MLRTSCEFSSYKVSLIVNNFPEFRGSKRGKTGHWRSPWIRRREEQLYELDKIEISSVHVVAFQTHSVSTVTLFKILWVRHSTRSNMKSSTRNDMTLADPDHCQPWWQWHAQSVGRMKDSIRKSTSSKTNLPILYFLLVQPTLQRTGFHPISLYQESGF
jgi:hypothetical protein